MKLICLIGASGLGKTDIAHRLARMIGNRSCVVAGDKFSCASGVGALAATMERLKYRDVPQLLYGSLESEISYEEWRGAMLGATSTFDVVIVDGLSLDFVCGVLSDFPGCMIAWIRYTGRWDDYAVSNCWRWARYAFRFPVRICWQLLSCRGWKRKKLHAVRFSFFRLGMWMDRIVGLAVAKQRRISCLNAGIHTIDSSNGIVGCAASIYESVLSDCARVEKESTWFYSKYGYGCS